MHIPKCAGTAISSAIRNAFAEQGDKTTSSETPSEEMFQASRILDRDKSPDIRAQRFLEYRQFLLFVQIENNQKLIQGHLPFSPLAVSLYPNYDFITVLRDPVERLISGIIFNIFKVRKSEKNWDPRSKIELLLKDDQILEFSNQLTRYLGGLDYRGRGEVTGAKRRALANLELFKLVGFVDELPEMAANFEILYGVPLNLVEKNVTSRLFKTTSEKREIYQIFEGSMREKIIDFCQDDLEVYGRAKKLFGKNRTRDMPFPSREFAAFESYFENLLQESGGLTRKAWFGQFQLGVFPWILHKEMGWIKCLGERFDNQNFSFRHRTAGVLATSQEKFPQVYSHKWKSWLGYKRGPFGKAAFYDYQSKEWLEH
ncbi:MAG: hypothetical protein GVY36_03375 [Verrucomicrobia bacterium]|nr:hypothetical protein [Verrucomicrobiota bacterium]